MIQLLLLLLSLNSVTVFAGGLFVHQPVENRAPGASVTQVNSFCLYTKHLPGDSCRSQHAGLLGLYL